MHSRKAFTLIELIVVVTIIGILGAIGFSSIAGYFAGARDGARIEDMNKIYSQLDITRGDLGGFPTPDNARPIVLSGTTYVYQGYLNQDILNAIKFEKSGRDPKDGTNYIYSVDKKLGKSQLMAYFEDYDTSKLSNASGGIVSTPYIAESGKYEDRRIGTIGKDICMFVESGSLLPVQDTGTGDLDIGATPDPYVIYCNNHTVKAGTGNILANTFVEDSVAYEVRQDLAAAFFMKKIFPAGYNSCGITADGGLKSWGGNIGGQLGNGKMSDSLIPVNVIGLSSGVIDLAISNYNYHTCVVVSGGKVKCWGMNNEGQLGNGTLNNSSVPSDVIGILSGAISIGVGYSHSCALMNNGGVKCWGANSNGQLGNGTFTDSQVSVDVTGLSSRAVKLKVEAYNACVLMDTGGVKCWGGNMYGQLGDGTFNDSPVPVDVTGLSSGVSEVNVGRAYHACVILLSGGVRCWGYNSNGQLGDGTFNDSPVPVDVTGLASGVRHIEPGYSNTCALTSTGGVKCWGYNSNGQLGDGTTTDSPVPVDVTGLASGVEKISMPEMSMCALTSAGGVKCWGYNGSSELGDGTTTDSPVPVDVIGLASGVVDISRTIWNPCAIMSTGEVQCWGYNGNGQLGDGTTNTPSSPVHVTGF